VEGKTGLCIGNLRHSAETGAQEETIGEDFAWGVESRGSEGVGLGGLATGSAALEEGTKFQGTRRRDSGMPGITLNDLEVARTAIQISDNPTDALKMIEQYMEEIQTANLGEHDIPPECLLPHIRILSP
jgi:hypothetical protein